MKIKVEINMLKEIKDLFYDFGKLFKFLIIV